MDRIRIEPLVGGKLRLSGGRVVVVTTREELLAALDRITNAAKSGPDACAVGAGCKKGG